MAPEGEFQDQEVEPPEELDPDRDKTVFDPETGEWKTINEAKQEAENRAEKEKRERLVSGESLLNQEPLRDSSGEDEETVFSPERGEWLTIEEARRRAAARTAGVDLGEGVGLIVDDVGKALVDRDGTEIGEIVHVEDGRADIRTERLDLDHIKTAHDIGEDEEGEKLQTVYEQRVQRQLGADSFLGIYRLSPAWVSNVSDETVQIEY